MVDQLGNALQAAHRSGVVHRDINPANILHRRRGQRLPVGLRDRRRRRGEVRRHPVRHLQPRRRRRPGPHRSAAVTSTQIRGALPPPVLRVIDRATDDDATSRYQSVDAFADRAAGDADRRHGAGTGTRQVPTRVAPDIDVPSRIRTRGCGRSTPPMPSTSTAGNDSSNGSSLGSVSREPAVGSSPWSVRAAAASRAS